MSGDYLSLTAAAELMNVSRFTMWRLVKDGKLRVYESERDRREKLVRRADVEALVRPRPARTKKDSGQDKA